MQQLLLLSFLLVIGFLIWFSVVSIIEKKLRAAVLSFSIAISLALGYAILFIFFNLLFVTIGAILIAIGTLFLTLILIPLKGKFKSTKEYPTKQFDERDTMFSRLEISKRTALQKEYYERNPEKHLLDKNWHSKPGLMSEKAAFYNPLTFKAADASFYTIEQLRPYVDGNVNKVITAITPEKASTFIRNWALKLGAVSVGFCEMQEYHYYSIGGRADRYNKEIQQKHKYGIAITVEMDEEYLNMGPAGPTLMESAKQYLNSGTIAVQIARFIRDLGYGARAHIDGNYEVICPTVARDSGLGEIGRMGLLMTPELGPRVRIAVVTTNLPLKISSRKPDYTMLHFCSICKKCADICPSQAISHTKLTEIDGVDKWQVNHEKCFGFWCTSGTDCGRCMSVCPYSHPNNLLHNFVRWGIKQNLLFRHVALKMDDIFYGRKPQPNRAPDWMNLA